MFAYFPFKWNHSIIHNFNLSKAEGRIPQILNIMAVLVGHLTIKFNSNMITDEVLYNAPIIISLKSN